MAAEGAITGRAGVAHAGAGAAQLDAGVLIEDEALSVEATGAASLRLVLTMDCKILFAGTELGY